MDVEKLDVFHTTIVESLFIYKRVRPHIKMTVPFICTMVKGPDKYDWKKLLIIINHPQETRDDKLILKINDMIMAYWYADADFAVPRRYENSHRNCIHHG